MTGVQTCALPICFPVTIGGVKDYEAQKGYTFSAEKFWGYYESNGWRVGKNPMKNWHGACVTWQGKQNEKNLLKNTVKRYTGINVQDKASRLAGNLTSFPLTNLDDMREDILAAIKK